MQMMRALLFALSAAGALIHASAHAYMSWPSSRNFDKCDFWNPHSLNGHCSNCNTDCCGKFGAIDFARVSHNPEGTYQAGGVLEVETIVTAHHMGYMEMRICGRSHDLSQECFDEHVLIRDEQTAEMDPAPVDEKYPGRWYIPPSGTNWPADSLLKPVENECSGSARNKGSWTKYQWRVRLPSDLECDHCVLQFFWVTANSCTPPGFREYFDNGATKTWIANKFGGDPSAWWGSTKSSCPPDIGDPKTNGNGAEKFWNCGDIKVIKCTESDCPATSTVPTTTRMTTTSESTSEPEPEPEPEPLPYNLHKGPGSDYCVETGMISESASLGQDDCESRCSADSACHYISLWASGGLNWCRLNSACDALGQQSWHTISIYRKAHEIRTTTTTTPMASLYELRKGPGSDHCTEHGMISESASLGQDDCKSRCTADPACQYISLWASGGLNWCRLSSACDALGQQSWHTIRIYRKVPETVTTTTAPAKDKELVAFVENWLPCPSIDKIKGYTKVIVAFAVSYVWRPEKNQCDPTCAISSPVPICDNLPQPGLVQEWKAEGAEVILSFGGAGMGGSWDGKNDCWEACFDRVDSVVSQLTGIVSTQGFDGVDIDYEYFLTAKSAAFLTDLTTKLKAALGPGKKVSHAPMDSDLDSGDLYFNVLKSVASQIDYLLPQYYNGFLRPVQDMLPVLSHYSDLVHEIFQGDESKVIFGFCISACPGFNVNSVQALQILEALSQEFPNNGGAFLWAASHDSDREWSRPVAEAIGLA